MKTSEELGFTKSHYRRLRKPRIRQVPRRQVHDYADCTKYPFGLTRSASAKHQVPRRPSTCTPTPHRNTEFLAETPNIYGTLCDYGCERPPSNPSYSDSSSPSTKMLYDYFRGRRPVYNYRRRGRLLPLLPLRTRTAPRMHLEGITAETMTRGRKHVLYEMHV